MPVPRVVQVFSHAQVILNLHTTSKWWWIAFRLPFVVNAFSCVPSAFSLWRLQNHAVFHVLSSATNHPFLQRLLGPHETSHWVGQAGSGVPPLVCFLIFSFFFLLTSSFAAKLPHSLPMDTVTFSLEGPLGPTTDRDDSDDA